MNNLQLYKHVQNTIQTQTKTSTKIGEMSQSVCLDASTLVENDASSEKVGTTEL